MVTWKIPGDWYHEHKDEFKRVRDEYGRLQFLGWREMAWKSEKEKVTLIAERYVGEDGKEKTKEVTLCWEGEQETWLLNKMKEMFGKFSADEMTLELRTFDEKVEYEIRQMYTSLNRPPEGFINAHIKRRLEERKTIVAKYANGGGCE